jgi:hypothetical protein
LAVRRPACSPPLSLSLSLSVVPFAVGCARPRSHTSNDHACEALGPAAASLSERPTKNNTQNTNARLIRNTCLSAETNRAEAQRSIDNRHTHTNTSFCRARALLCLFFSCAVVCAALRRLGAHSWKIVRCVFYRPFELRLSSGAKRKGWGAGGGGA